MSAAGVREWAAKPWEERLRIVASDIRNLYLHDAPPGKCEDVAGYVLRCEDKVYSALAAPSSPRPACDLCKDDGLTCFKCGAPHPPAPSSPPVEAVDDGTCDDGFPHRCGRCDRDVVSTPPPSPSPAANLQPLRDLVAITRDRMARPDAAGMTPTLAQVLAECDALLNTPPSPAPAEDEGEAETLAALGYVPTKPSPSPAPSGVALWDLYQLGIKNGGDSGGADRDRDEIAAYQRRVFDGWMKKHRAESADAGEETSDGK